VAHVSSQAAIVSLAREVIKGVAQEMHVAALPGGFGQDLCDGLAQTSVIG
jgi:hypothetical protein